MAMPINLILVRHGESEGNLANDLSRKGDHSAFTEEFKKRSSAHWRLTDRGRSQARAAGQWLRMNFSDPFDRRYSSDFIRALETAGNLGIPGPWFREVYLTERSWGQLDVMSQQEREERFAEEMARRERDNMYWSPSGGETAIDVCVRLYPIFHMLHRECSDMNVLMVCHGDVIRPVMSRLQRMTQQQYEAMSMSRDPLDRIHNCQIVHYTRRNPDTGELSRHLNWVKKVCPWDAKLSRGTWQYFDRPRYTSADLLKEVEAYPQLVNS